MKKLDLILCILEVILMITCLVFEFVPISEPVHKTLIICTAIYNLAGLIYFEVRKYLPAYKFKIMNKNTKNEKED